MDSRKHVNMNKNWKKYEDCIKTYFCLALFPGTGFIFQTRGFRLNVYLEKKTFFFYTGAGVFVTTVVSGSICLIKPFHMAERPFLRDVIFYIGAIFMTYWVLNNGIITLGESIGEKIYISDYIELREYDNDRTIYTL